MSVSARQKTLVVLICVCISLFIAPAISAEQPPKSKGTLQVEPAYVEVTLNKDQPEETFDIFYTNNSTSPVTLDIFPVDFKQASDKGGISFLGKEANTYSYSLSSFLTFEANQLVVDPGEKRKYTVRVKNRQDLSPGGHYAAVVARVASEGKQTVVAPALSSLIYMKKVGGELFHINVSDLDWPKSVFVFHIPNKTNVIFQNEGNIHIIPYGKVEIKDLFGRVIYNGSLNSSSAIVMPESRRLIPVELHNVGYNFPLAFNIFTLSGHDSLNKVGYSYQETFIYIHPGMAGFLPLLIFLVWILIRRRKRKKNVVMNSTEEVITEEISNPKVKKQKRPAKKKRTKV